MARLILPLLVFGCAAFFAVRHFQGGKQAPPPPPPVVEVPEPISLSDADMERIFEATKDPSPRVKWAAIELLYRRGDPNADKLIKESLALETDPRVRLGTIEVLWRLRHPEARKMLQQALSLETDPEVRRRALELLKADPSKEGTSQMLPALRDPDAGMRSAALSAIGARGDKKLAPEILQMLSDPEPEVRAQALRALAQLQERRAAEYRALQAELRRNYEEVVERSRHPRTALFDEQREDHTVGVDIK